MYKLLSGLSLVIGTLFASLNIGNDSISDGVLFVSIFISAVFLILSPLEEYRSSLSNMIVIALFIRFLFMLWGVYGKDIYRFPGMGSDGDGFYAWAVQISKDISLLKGRVYGDTYTRLLALLFWATRPSYLLGAYLNYVFSVISISLLYKTICRIDFLDDKTIRFATLCNAFLPNYITTASSLRRESMIMLFVVASVYYLVKWTEKCQMSAALKALLFVLAGSALHAGVIGLSVGYVILFIFYDPRLKKWRFTTRSIVLGTIIAIGAALVLIRYRSVFLRKILVDSADDLYQHADRAKGGAAYLTGMHITSMRSLILYTPLKLFYFISSPVPWNWRGGSDLFAFFMDAMIYVMLAVGGAKSLFLAKKDPPTFSVGLSCLSCLIIYAIGTQNSGTAMRHRLKMLGVMIVVMCMVRAYKNKQKHDFILDT